MTPASRSLETALRGAQWVCGTRAVQEKLKAAGIPTAVHYPIPLNRQPAVADPAAQLPVGDALAQRVLSLPTHPYLDKDSIARIVQVILNRNSRRP